MKKIFLFFVLTSHYFYSQNRLINHNQSIYDFLERISAKRIISTGYFAKPYSMKDISSMLIQVIKNQNNLTLQEREEAYYYLGLYQNLIEKSNREQKKVFELKYGFQDSTINLNLKPIVGIGSKRIYGEFQFKRYWGFEAYGSFSNWLSFQTDFRDNWEKGRNLNRYKIFENETYPLIMVSDIEHIEYSEAKGAILFHNEWADFGIVKENFIWGDGINSQLIFSKRAPSFPALYLQMKWKDYLRFYYLHGWLISRVEDTAKTYETPVRDWSRRIERKKYLAAHAVEIRPISNLSLTFGETIIYSDMDLQLNYLLPFAFYRSIDHSYEGSGGYRTGNNGSLFLNLSYIPFYGFKFFGSFFIDEFSLSNFLKGKNDRNQTAYQVGLKNYGFIDNLLLSLEYAKIMPWVYSNYVPAQTYTHAGALLGHYIDQNSDQIYSAIEYWFTRGFKAKAFFERTRNGEFGDLNLQYDETGEKFLYGRKRMKKSFGIELSYENWGGFNLSASYRYDDIIDENFERTPDWMLKYKHSFGIFIRYGY